MYHCQQTETKNRYVKCVLQLGRWPEGIKKECRNTSKYFSSTFSIYLPSNAGVNSLESL